MSRFSDDRRDRQPTVTVRHIDSAYHAFYRDDHLEATHRAALERYQAWDLVKQIRKGLEQGRDLDLAHWDVEATT